MTQRAGAARREKYRQFGSAVRNASAERMARKRFADR